MPSVNVFFYLSFSSFSLPLFASCRCLRFFLHIKTLTKRYFKANESGFSSHVISHGGGNKGAENHRVVRAENRKKKKKQSIQNIKKQTKKTKKISTYTKQQQQKKKKKSFKKSQNHKKDTKEKKKTEARRAAPWRGAGVYLMEQRLIHLRTRAQNPSSSNPPPAALKDRRERGLRRGSRARAAGSGVKRMLS